MKTFGGHISTISRGLFGLLSGVAFTGWSQGTILFDTRVEGFVDAPIYGEYGLIRLTGNDYFAQLYVGADAGSFIAIGPPVNFGTGPESGYVNAGELDVPFLPAFAQAVAMIRFWRMDSRYGVVGSTFPISVTLAEKGTSGSAQSTMGKLNGLSSYFLPTVLRPISVNIRLTTDSVVLEWFDQGLFSPYVFVPEEADSPNGPWRDIKNGGGPWITESGGRFTPPNPLTLPKPDGTRFYRIRLTTNTGP